MVHLLACYKQWCQKHSNDVIPEQHLSLCIIVSYAHLEVPTCLHDVLVGPYACSVIDSGMISGIYTKFNKQMHCKISQTSLQRTPLISNK